MTSVGGKIIKFLVLEMSCWQDRYISIMYFIPSTNCIVKFDNCTRGLATQIHITIDVVIKLFH